MSTRKPIYPSLVILGALFASGFAMAEQPASEAELPVYTNADLLKFGQPSTVEPGGGSDAVEKTDTMAWEATRDFIEREYSRLEAERRLRLERVRTRKQQKESATRSRFTRSYHSVWDSGATFTNAVSAASEAKILGDSNTDQR